MNDVPEAARQKIAHYHHEAQMARMLSAAPSLWIQGGHQILKVTRRLEAWLLRHLPADEQASPGTARLQPAQPLEP